MGVNLPPLGHYPLQQELRHRDQCTAIEFFRSLRALSITTRIKTSNRRIFLIFGNQTLRALSITTRIKTDAVTLIGLPSTPLGHYPLQQGLRRILPTRRQFGRWPLGHYPLQQGLRPFGEKITRCDLIPLGHYPLQQGLRQTVEYTNLCRMTLRALSITTRIKTCQFFINGIKFARPLGHYPLQQGLRPVFH